jgi:hypothetical protein
LLNEWQEAICKVFGNYGDYEFRFRPNGLFIGLKVWSDLAKTEIDLTEYDKI